MKILIIVNGLVPPIINMAGLKALYDLQKAIAKHSDTELHILTSNYLGAIPDCQKWAREQEKLFGLKIDVVNMRKWKNVLLELLVSRIKFLYYAFQITKQEEIDIIHDYSSAPLIFLFSFFYKKIMKKTVFHTLCTSNTGSLASYHFNWGIRYIDRVICASRYLTKKLKDCVPDKYKDRVSYISLGVKADRFSSRAALEKDSLKQRLNLPPSEKIILFVGSLEERKGAFVLAQAANKILERNNRVHFILATYGEGGIDRRHLENKQRLLEIVKKHRNSISILEGVHDIPCLLTIADIFVLPAISSHGTLAQPLTLLEAMAAGKAIIASKIEGVEEIIADNNNGLLFNRGDHNQLAEKIVYLIGNQERAKELGLQAQKDVRDYDISLSSQKISNFYKNPKFKTLNKKSTFKVRKRLRKD